MGEILHSFSLDDIKRGAVRESGILPELFERKWPQFSSGVLVTGVERKFHEQRNALKYGEFDFPIFLPPAIISEPLEDSKEEESTHLDIAIAKSLKGFVLPVRSKLASLSAKERRALGQKIAVRAKTDDVAYITAIADDRNMNADIVFLEPVYGHLRDHWNAQVREIFTLPEVPGWRVKETDGANYGVANSLYKFQQAAKSLRAQGVTFTEKYRMDTVLSFVPLVPGRLPLPEQGLIVKAIGEPFERSEITEEDRARIRRGRILTYDRFNRVSDPAAPEQTVCRLKKIFPQHRYLAETFSPAAAMTAFAHAVELPRLGESKRQRPSVRQFKPKTVVSSAGLITAPPAHEEIRSTLALPNGMQLTKDSGRNGGGLTNLRRLEAYAYSGQAFVVQDPDKFEARATRTLTAEQVKFLRRLETDLIYSYLITMSTQGGAPNHIGRPHMVSHTYFNKRGLWHPDFCNLGLAGDDEQEAFVWYRTGDELEKGLQNWNDTLYQHDVKTPPDDFLKEDDIKRILRMGDFGYVVSGYGSASTFIDNAYKDARSMFYRLSKLENTTTIDGGGVRSAMLGMKDGVLQALREGYRVRNIGIRSQSDVSPQEGNVEDWIRSEGFEVHYGRDKRHLHFADGQMHVLQLNRLLQRQAPIAALSHASVFFPGGKGTVVEINLTKLHNALVEFTGRGLFPGYSRNNQKKPLVFIDHEFDYLGARRSIFDKVLSLDSEAEKKMLDMHVFKGPDRIERAAAFIQNHAAQRGFDLRENGLRVQNEPDLAAIPS